MQEKTGRLYEFDSFVLDTSQHVLLRDGNPVPLTPKTFDMLLVLVENSGRMLSKKELMDALWPDSFVEESNLTQQVSMIRKALGESPGEDRYVVTVAGRGYRFVAAVKAPPENSGPAAKGGLSRPVETAKESSGVESEETVQPRQRGMTAPVVAAAVTARKQFAWFVYIAIAIVVLALGIFSYRSHANQSQFSRAPRSLAILPFQSLRQDPENDFLGFSLADAVITKLDYVSSLAVRPSLAVKKYKNQTVDIQRVAAELQADILLTGNFLRDGDDLRITSQLIEVKTERILWRRTFDLKYDKLLTVQDTVVGQIIGGLKLTLPPLEAERLKPYKPIDSLAYEYYLRGVDLYSGNNFPVAIQMLQKSAEIDSNYALTWAQLGRAHTANASLELGGRDEYLAAQRAYEKALSLEPAQIEARIYMANLFTDTGRVEGAVPLLRDALRTNPNHSEAHWELGYAYRFAGMLNESVAECERARELDPGVKITSSALNSYLYLGRYDQFIQSLPKHSDSPLIVFYRGFAEYYRNHRQEAARHFDRAWELRPSLLQAKIGRALSEDIGGRTSQGLQLLQETTKNIEDRGVRDPEATLKIAQAYSVLGDKVSALKLLRYSVENGFFSYPYLVSDPLLENVRREPEFAGIAALASKRHEAFKQMFF